jgi:hypothetical protein
MKRVILLLLLLPACEDDPAQPQGSQNTQAFQALTTREAVLHNLELAWSKRNADKIDELLDDDFAFYLSQSDVHNGLPPVWDRATEMAATADLLTSNTAPAPSGPVCSRVSADIRFDDDLIWTEVPIPAAASGEVWYSTTVFYTFTFEMEPDDTYIAVPGAEAEFVVRRVATERGDRWRLVEWRDIGGDSPRLTATTGVKPTTWGAIKAIYR